MAEVWTNGAGMPSAFVRRAQWAEAAGFDGITIVDSQNLSGDCYIALAMAAAATTRIKLGTGVTNPFTRHPAVTAGAIATVQPRYVGRLQGSWRWIYAVGAVLALYLNTFVGVVQAFEKIPALHRLAPTQAEPPFAIAQVTVLLLFLVLGVLTGRRFRPAAAALA
jgi:hypothetical protein